jgi:hypothetical protein
LQNLLPAPFNSGLFSKWHLEIRLEHRIWRPKSYSTQYRVSIGSLLEYTVVCALIAAAAPPHG